MRHRDRETKRQTGRQRQRQTDRQTDRHIYRERERGPIDVAIAVAALERDVGLSNRELAALYEVGHLARVQRYVKFLSCIIGR